MRVLPADLGIQLFVPVPLAALHAREETAELAKGAPRAVVLCDSGKEEHSEKDW